MRFSDLKLLRLQAMAIVCYLLVACVRTLAHFSKFKT
jgi:hypothetical protein